MPRKTRKAKHKCKYTRHVGSETWVRRSDSSKKKVIQIYRCECGNAKHKPSISRATWRPAR